MQLIAVVALAVACPQCCSRGAVREEWHPALLARGALVQPAAGLGSGDPAATEAIASGPTNVVDLPEDTAEVEMATADPALIKMAIQNLTEFEEVVLAKMMMICMVPPSQLMLKLQSDLGEPAAPVMENVTFKAVPPHPAAGGAPVTLLQQARRVRAEQAAAATTNVSAVMWVLYIIPSNETAPNVTNVTNATNATNSTPCPPCPCDPKEPVLFPGLSPAEAAALAGRSPTFIADDLVGQARGGDTPLHGLLPQTTARRPHRNFPPILRNSVTIGSRQFQTGALSDTGRSMEATKINEGTQELVKELRARLEKANRARTEILTGDQVSAPEFDGFTVTIAQDEDPWSELSHEDEADDAHKALRARKNART